MTATTPEQMHFTLNCESPGTRLSAARDESRCDWPSCGFPATIAPQRVIDAFRTHLRSHPGIDHIVFTATGRAHHRPYLEAHVVDGCVHVTVAPLHSAGPHARAIVHQLHAAITEAFEHRRAATIEIPTDAAGLGQWARTVLAQAPADSADAAMVHKVLGLLRDDRTGTCATGNDDRSAEQAEEPPTAFVVIQEAAGEWYVKACDTEGEAEELRRECARDGDRTTPPLEMPSDTDWDALEELINQLEDLERVEVDDDEDTEDEYDEDEADRRG